MIENSVFWPHQNDIHGVVIYMYEIIRHQERSLGQKYQFWVGLGLIEKDIKIFAVNTTGNSIQKVFMKICDSK